MSRWSLTRGWEGFRAAFLQGKTVEEALSEAREASAAKSSGRPPLQKENRTDKEHFGRPLRLIVRFALSFLDREIIGRVQPVELGKQRVVIVGHSDQHRVFRARYGSQPSALL